MAKCALCNGDGCYLVRVLQVTPCTDHWGPKEERSKTRLEPMRYTATCHLCPAGRKYQRERYKDWAQRQRDAMKGKR